MVIKVNLFLILLTTLIDAFHETGLFLYPLKTWFSNVLIWSRDRTVACNELSLSWRRPLSYRKKSIDLRSKSMNWFLYDIGLRHERVNDDYYDSSFLLLFFCYICYLSHQSNFEKFVWPAFINAVSYSANFKKKNFQCDYLLKWLYYQQQIKSFLVNNSFKRLKRIEPNIIM